MLTEEQQGASVPEDFEAFEKWRNSPEKEAPAAQEETPEPEPAPDSDPDTTQEEDEKGEKDKAVKGVQKRIDELTKARREAERKADEAERKLAEIQGSRPADKNAPANPTEPTGKPKIEDFPTIEAYYEALTDFKIEQREKAAADKAQADKAKESASQAQKDWETRVETFKSDHSDYDEAIDSVKIPNNSPSIKELSQAVFAGGPELLYQLAKAPDEVARIAALPPIEALLALGEFKAKIPAPEKQPQKVSSAPKPPARVGGTAPTAKAIDDPNLEYADFEKLRNAQERRRR